MTKKTQEKSKTITFSMTELRIIEMGAAKVETPMTGRRIVRPLLKSIKEAFANSVDAQKKIVEKNNKEFDSMIEKEMTKLRGQEKERLEALIKKETDTKKKAEMKKGLKEGVAYFVKQKTANLKEQTKEARTQTINGALNKFFMDTRIPFQADTSSMNYFVFNIWNKIHWGSGEEADQGLLQMVDGIDEKLCKQFPALNKEQAGVTLNEIVETQGK